MSAKNNTPVILVSTDETIAPVNKVIYSIQNDATDTSGLVVQMRVIADVGTLSWPGPGTPFTIVFP